MSSLRFVNSGLKYYRQLLPHKAGIGQRKATLIYFLYNKIYFLYNKIYLMFEVNELYKLLGMIVCS